MFDGGQFKQLFLSNCHSAAHLNLDFLPQKTRQQGFSLLELLFALLILTILILGGITQYHRYQKAKSLEALKHNILILKEATIGFYHQQCVSAEQLPFENRFEALNFNIERVKAAIPFQLQPSDLINPITEKKPEDSFVFEGYEIYAEPFGDPVHLPKGVDEQHARVILYSYRLKLKAHLSAHLTPEAAASYQSLLEATRIDGKTLTWDYLPKAPRQKTGDQLWIIETGLQEFKKRAMENLSAGSTQEGMISQCGN